MSLYQPAMAETLLQRFMVVNLTLFLAPSMIVSICGRGKVSLTVIALIFL